MVMGRETGRERYMGIQTVRGEGERDRVRDTGRDRLRESETGE